MPNIDPQLLYHVNQIWMTINYFYQYLWKNIFSFCKQTYMQRKWNWPLRPFFFFFWNNYNMLLTPQLEPFSPKSPSTLCMRRCQFNYKAFGTIKTLNALTCMETNYIICNMFHRTDVQINQPIIQYITQQLFQKFQIMFPTMWLCNLKLFERLCLNIKCIMFYFIAQNLYKLWIILDGTYLLLNLPNIHYAQLFIRF